VLSVSESAGQWSRQEIQPCLVGAPRRPSYVATTQSEYARCRLLLQCVDPLRHQHHQDGRRTHQAGSAHDREEALQPSVARAQQRDAVGRLGPGGVVDDAARAQLWESAAVVSVMPYGSIELKSGIVRASCARTSSPVLVAAPSLSQAVRAIHDAGPRILWLSLDLGHRGGGEHWRGHGDAGAHRCIVRLHRQVAARAASDLPADAIVLRASRAWLAGITQ
jgi:hypothetical protein